MAVEELFRLVLLFTRQNVLFVMVYFPQEGWPAFVINVGMFEHYFPKLGDCIATVVDLILFVINERQERFRVQHCGLIKLQLKGLIFHSVLLIVSILMGGF